MACKRPVVITPTQGMADYLATPDITKVVDVGDAAGLREAIVHLLKNPQEAESQALRGYEMVVKQHRSERYVDVLARSCDRFNKTVGCASPHHNSPPEDAQCTPYCYR